MQKRDKYRVLQLKKNRFDGEVGQVGLIFNKENKRFMEISRSEVANLLKNEISV
jgi:twinkle protein